MSDTQKHPEGSLFHCCFLRSDQLVQLCYKWSGLMILEIFSKINDPVNYSIHGACALCSLNNLLGYFCAWQGM